MILQRELFVIFVGVLWFWCKSCVSGFSEFQFDVNYILEEKLMPTRLLAEQFSEYLSMRDTIFNFPQNTPKNAKRRNNTSDFGSALTTMEFHRRMMNEFLATTFLAKELLTPPEVVWVSRRIGTVKTDSEFNSTTFPNSQMTEEPTQRKSKHFSNHKLLMDEGSMNYKDWLERSTTLEDIHRQFEGLGMPSSTMVHAKRKRQKLSNNRRNAPDSIDIAEDDQEYEDGDITGYALSSSLPETPQSRLTSPDHLYVANKAVNSDAQSSIPFTQIINKNGYETTYDSYGVQPPHPQPHPHANPYIHLHPQPQSHPQPHPQTYAPTHPPPISAISSIQNKEISLKDITDIALTTLAFLSFGMFILQVLMCITMGKEDTTTMMMMPMDAGDNGGDMTDDGTEEIRRRKRRSTSNFQLNQMNDLVRRVLHSINAVFTYSEDNGSCHYVSICEHNRFARTQLNGQKLWIPLWSLGVSWLISRRSLYSDDLKRNDDYAPILKSLKATIIGLANENCTLHYGKAC